MLTLHLGPFAYISCFPWHSLLSAILSIRSYQETAKAFISIVCSSVLPYSQRFHILLRFSNDFQFSFDHHREKAQVRAYFAIANIHPAVGIKTSLLKT
jgi:hypothetical protein